MAVTVDDQLLATDTLGLSTVGQVFHHLQRDDRLVVHVLIDGHEPDLGNLQQLRAAPLQGHTLFIETAEPHRMAIDVLDGIKSHLTDTKRLRGEAVDLLRKQSTVAALERLRDCFTAWQSAQESVLKTAQLLRIDLDRIIVEGRPFSRVLNEFAEQLKLIKSSLENRDFVSLIDTLVYETAETTEHWLAAIHVMRGVINA